MFYREKKQINNSEEKKQKGAFSTKKPLLSRVKDGAKRRALPYIVRGSMIWSTLIPIGLASHCRTWEDPPYAILAQEEKSKGRDIPNLETHLVNPTAYKNWKKLKKLEAAAIDGNHQAISTLTEILDLFSYENEYINEDEYIRCGAAWALEAAARNGQDISQAIPVLTEILNNKDEHWFVIKPVVSALTLAAEKGQDISRAIPRLTELLNDEYKFVAMNAVWALKAAAEKGQDVSRAIPALTELLNDEDPYVREAAVFALEAAAENWLVSKTMSETTISALAERLNEKNKYVREGAAWALGYAARNGRDISQAIPALTKVLEDEGLFVRRKAAAKALGYAAKNGQNISQAIPALTKAREDEDPYVGEAAAAKALEFHRLNNKK